jgi:hypothetical protein
MRGTNIAPDLEQNTPSDVSVDAEPGGVSFHDGPDFRGLISGSGLRAGRSLDDRPRPGPRPRDGKITIHDPARQSPATARCRTQ